VLPDRSAVSSSVHRKRDRKGLIQRKPPMVPSIDMQKTRQSLRSEGDQQLLPKTCSEALRTSRWCQESNCGCIQFWTCAPASADRCRGQSAARPAIANGRALPAHRSNTPEVRGDGPNWSISRPQGTLFRRNILRFRSAVWPVSDFHASIKDLASISATGWEQRSEIRRPDQALAEPRFFPGYPCPQYLL